MVPGHTASKQGRIRHELLEARSRPEIFRHICAVVFEVAPQWGDAIDDGVAIVVSGPLLTRSDVQSAFDEISEKYRVAGIDLRFDEHDGGPLHAIFEPIDRPDPRRVLRPPLTGRSLTRQTPRSAACVTRGGQ